VLFDADAIARRVDELARRIAAAMPGEFLVVVVLKGSFVFAADLIRALHSAGATARVDFITLASYGTGTESAGQVALLRDLSEDVAGQRVLLVDDIVDTGRTLKFAKEELLRRGAAEVRTCLLLDKAARRVVEMSPDYVGFSIPDRFVVGYGLDLAHYYRGLPYIGVVTSAP
jgi:hypoxanthine phosphoribosyltransferase